MTYECKFTTADLPGAGTDGQVYITLVGEQGASKPFRLQDEDFSSEKCFFRNTSNTFTVTAWDMGALQSMVVRLVRDGIQAST